MLANLFFILLVALVGGLVARLAKLPPLVGYIVAGVVGGLVSSFDSNVTTDIAEIGVVLLLFSVGLEISFEKLMNVGKVAVYGAILQMFLVTVVLFCVFVAIGNVPPNAALVVSFSFSLSSTALIVKLLRDANEEGTISYQILTAWALVQDLAVIPMVVLLPTLAIPMTGSSWANVALSSILTTLFILGIVFFVGKMVFPYLTRLVASLNNQEFLVLLAVTLAFGVASLVGLFGISSAFGAFLAGVVISNTQEKYAIFSETRPLRDIFSILFFVSLGFLLIPSFLISHFLSVVLLTAFVIILKIVVVFLLCQFFDYKGRTAVFVSFGLAEVGEFAFVLMIIAQKLGIVTNDLAQITISTTILSLLAEPFLLKSVRPFLKWFKKAAKNTFFEDLFAHGDSKPQISDKISGHVIIVGFGRMGKWIGKALKEINVEFVVVDYNHKIIHEAKSLGVKAVYGDASFPEILEEAQIKNAKAILITLPDIYSQEEIILYVQKNFPNIKIMARAHLDSDIKRLGTLKLEKVVQPEFEAALAIVRKILETRGQPSEKVRKQIKALRLSHANI